MHAEGQEAGTEESHTKMGCLTLLVLIVIASISQQRRKIFIKSKNATLLWPLL